MHRTRTAASIAVTVAATAALSACAGDEAPDFSGVEITVGSRDFTEQYMLSAILVEALDRYGATVTDATDTGDIATTRSALETGDIDAYWEYNSAALVEVFGEAGDPAADPDDLTDRAAELDDANGIEWVGRSSFSNTYGFALSPGLGAEHQPNRYDPDAFDLDDLAELLDDEADLMVCVEDAFLERADGMALFEEGTGFAIPADRLVVVASIDEVYPLVSGRGSGECDVVEVFTTDPQIAEYDLDVVENDDVFLTYNASLTLRDEVYEQAPDRFDALVDDILGALSRQRIIELNARAAGGEPLDQIAADFVTEFLDD